MERYEVRSWVCDSGIWDNKNKYFVGKPIESETETKRIFEIMFKGIKY